MAETIEIDRAERAPAPSAHDDPRNGGDRSTSREDAGRLVAATLLLLLPVAGVGLCFWPGHMSADTLAQIDQVRTGDFTNQHAPLLMALWRPFFEAGAGPGWVLTAQLLAFVLGSYLVLRAAFRPLGAAAVVAAVSFLPPVFGMLGYVGRDTWFTALFVLTFGLTVRSTQARWPLRWAWIAAAVAAAWLTLASRQNAAAGVVLALILLAGVLLSRSSERRGAPQRLLTGRWRPLLAATVTGVAMTLALMATQVAGTALLGVRDVDPEQYLYIYDLAALSEHEHQNLFPAAVMPERGMRPVDAFWNVDSMNGYVFGEKPPIGAPLPKHRMADLRAAWLDAIGDDPLAYADERLDLFLRNLAITRAAMWTYHPVIDPNAWGYAVRFPGPNQAAKDYVEAFAGPALDGNWIYSIWAYMLLAAAAAAVLLRRSRPWPLLAVGAFALAVIAYQSGLFVVAMGTQYRFQLPVVVAGLLGAAVLLRLAWSRRRGA